MQELTATTATALSPLSEATALITDQQRNLNYITRKDYSNNYNDNHNQRRSDDDNGCYDELEGSAMRMMMMNKNVERNANNSTPLKSSQSQLKIHTPPQRKIMINHDDEYSNQQYHQHSQQLQLQQNHVNHSPRVNKSLKTFTEDRIPIDINGVNSSSSMINHHHQDRRKHIGAAAAPFANEYSWQVDN